MILISILLASSFAQAASHAGVDEFNVPEVVSRCMADLNDSTLTLSARMNPFYLRGDFDGDGRADYAALVTQVQTGKAGILVCFGRKQKPARIGAGATFVLSQGHKTDDLSVFDAWNIEEPDSHFKRDRIHLVAKEKGSGLISWNGHALVWKQVAE